LIVIVLTSSQKHIIVVSGPPVNITMANGPEPSVRVYALTCCEITKTAAHGNRKSRFRRLVPFFWAGCGAKDTILQVQ
jgi:hypothetical protein